ncbi:MAG: hypothetical protein JNL80_13600 [Phycisphaerae bacterium]|nr:hypothetical protein [Phycisphaerae bacterium]
MKHRISRPDGGRLSHALGFVVLGSVACATTTPADAAPRGGGGLDLQIDHVEFSQAIQTEAPSIPLVEGRAAMVRVYVSWNMAAHPTVPNVSATLTINGTTYTQTNDDPMTLDSAKGPDVFDGTINFWVRVDTDIAVCRVELDPDDLVAETNETNNVLEWNETFECRRGQRIAYSRVNYLAEGAPSGGKVGAGSGELFVRAIYPIPELEYVQWPTIRVTSSVDDPGVGSDLDASELLGKYSAVRNIVNASARLGGDPVTDNVYAWFPGDLNGNGLGQVNGHVAFGNTENSRFQRTFAHELGHNFGLDHANETLGWHGTDVRRLLDRSIVQDQSLAGIMWPALTSDEAFVGVDEYSHVLQHERLACDSGDRPAGGDDAIWFYVDVWAGFENGAWSINPLFEYSGGVGSASFKDLKYFLRAFDGGVLVDEIGTRTVELAPDGPGSRKEVLAGTLHITYGGWVADRIEIVDATSGRVLAQRLRSPNAPTAVFMNIDSGASISNGIPVTWAVADQDGDPVDTLLFWSWNDGQSWVPIDLGMGEPFSVTLDTISMPGSLPGAGRLRLMATDGLNTTTAEIDGLTLGELKPPTVAIISPRDRATGRVFHFECSATDMEDGGLLEDTAVLWTSSIDGPLGLGQSITVENLTVGVHQICVEGTDSHGMSATACVEFAVLASGGPPACCDAPIRIDEIRVAHPGGPPQWNEFFELGGTPGMPLDCYFYIVIGPGGIVDDVVNLAGHAIPPSGRFLCGQVSPIPVWGVVPDMVEELNFLEVGDRVHMLVCSCSGITLPPGGDLDVNNDGVLETIPWDCSLDCVTLVDAAPNPAVPSCGLPVGPQVNGMLPPHIFRCVPNGNWRIGPTPLVGGADTPGAENPPCFITGDLDGDGIVAGADLATLLGAWGGTGGAADLDGDGTIGGSDLAILLGAWTGS